MQEFVPGQRWINEAELQLGLGTVMKVEHRTVQMVFLATGDTRIYARNNAPLTRVKFAEGDEIRSEDGSMLLVKEVFETNGLLSYQVQSEQGEQSTLDEGLLDNFMQFNRPQERLLTGQIDPNKWFELRYQSWQAVNELAHSELRGLTGARTSLIPHQLYIAHEVARRFAPRVLLADEVGLGKTIEAGLILHHQLLTERAKRTLIVVPETLLHQWLVEMLRKFNLHFSVFDAERYAESKASSLDDESADENSTEGQNETGSIDLADIFSLGDDEIDQSDTDATSVEPSIESSIELPSNPFMTEQLVLCSLDFLADNPDAFSDALDGEWDMLIVDEAHHLHWSEKAPSHEYELVSQLASRTPGVLLLTATPEQLGKESHFARLRLLDPDRFDSFADFIDEEQSYAPIADAIDCLLDDTQSVAAQKQALAAVFDKDEDKNLLERLDIDASSTEAAQKKNQEAKEDLLDHLLDRHGTGRILFRNTRSAVSGFPGRELCSYELALPDEYSPFAHSITPEAPYRESTLAKQWFDFDPRIEWLRGMIKQHKRDKLLVITASAETALDLAEALRVQTGIHAAVFHEGMSIIERDRAAAYFADLEYGSQLLICSEIGSEGRNFQFAHHLALFDLPRNPDLLEQRIGRLDRIGQTETIKIHVPYFAGTAQETLYRWYHDGLNAFEHACPAAHTVYSDVTDELTTALGVQTDHTALLEKTRALTNELNEKLHNGRDRLLEYNSCRPKLAAKLAQQAKQDDMESDLPMFMDDVYDCFGVDSEIHQQNSMIIRPTENMFVPFPYLPEEGMTITYDRNTALANEDVHFVSWDHRMVIAALDMILGNEKGNCAVMAVKSAALKPGTLLLESLFVIECPQQSSRYLPPSTIRILLNEQGKPLHHAVSHELLQAAGKKIDRKTANRVVHARTAELETLVRSSKKLAEADAVKLTEEALHKANHSLGEEISRLKALKALNPNVRDAEITFYTDELEKVNQIIKASNLRLDALRVIVAI